MVSLRPKKRETKSYKNAGIQKSATRFSITAIALHKASTTRDLTISIQKIAFQNRVMAQVINEQQKLHKLLSLLFDVNWNPKPTNFTTNWVLSTLKQAHNCVPPTKKGFS